MQSKVFFMCNQIDVLETDEEVVEDEVIEEDVGEDEEE